MLPVVTCAFLGASVVFPLAVPCHAYVLWTPMQAAQCTERPLHPQSPVGLPLTGILWLKVSPLSYFEMHSCLQHLPDLQAPAGLQKGLGHLDLQTPAVLPWTGLLGLKASHLRHFEMHSCPQGLPGLQAPVGLQKRPDPPLQVWRKFTLTVLRHQYLLRIEAIDEKIAPSCA